MGDRSARRVPPGGVHVSNGKAALHEVPTRKAVRMFARCGWAGKERPCGKPAVSDGRLRQKWQRMHCLALPRYLSYYDVEARDIVAADSPLP